MKSGDSDNTDSEKFVGDLFLAKQGGLMPNLLIFKERKWEKGGIMTRNTIH